MIAIDKFAARYVAVWNEPDAAARDAAVAGAAERDARTYTDVNEYVGLDAITQRVAAVYEKFVAGRGFILKPLGPAQAHHDRMRIHWEMAPATGGDATSGGV